MKKTVNFYLNKSRNIYTLAALLFLSGIAPTAKAQVVVDKILAVVGSKIILQSDIEKQHVQYIAQGAEDNSQTKCLIFDQLLLQKLLLNQAEIDSVTVSESQVDGELDRRMRFYIKQIGSEEKLEEYFHTTIRELKAELRDMIREQLLVQSMQSTITKDVVATPSNVREYFESIHPDSLPYIDAEMEVGQIVRKPPVSDSERKSVKARLEEYRKKIMAGEDFAVYAALYSEDKSTAKKGGELGMFERGTMVPEFEAAAFNLRTGEVSPIIETKFGFHILQLIERRADQINVRHILLQPQTDEKDLYKSYALLDSLRKQINLGTISFDEAAQKFSDDEETRNNGGLLVNPETGTTRLSPDKMDRLLFFQVDSMALNTVSMPLGMATAEGKQAYRIVMVKSKNLPHRANLKDDYQKIQEVALQQKQNELLTTWVENKKSVTYIHLNDTFDNCEMLKAWTNSGIKQ
ncbi:MAG: peptidylprolyl isomerase [Bacteroidetes bacterium]|nr:MAG: peptidylprolyl isomerase [Bacteroidota bacterium]